MCAGDVNDVDVEDGGKCHRECGSDIPRRRPEGVGARRGMMNRYSIRSSIGYRYDIGIPRRRPEGVGARRGS